MASRSLAPRCRPTLFLDAERADRSPLSPQRALLRAQQGRRTRSRSEGTGSSSQLRPARQNRNVDPPSGPMGQFGESAWLAELSRVGRSGGPESRTCRALGSHSGMGEPPRLQTKPSGGPKGRGSVISPPSARHMSRLQPTCRAESLAFRRGRFKNSRTEQCRPSAVSASAAPRSGDALPPLQDAPGRRKETRCA